ncbi:MAG: YybH family protein [Xenococcaceae cyanobacterium]
MTFTSDSKQAPSTSTIDQIASEYFETINTGDFEATAALFAENGEMHPPFESTIAGREAIARYLQVEAKGMRLEPQQSNVSTSEDNFSKVNVTGKVFTPLFSVNASWQFLLNSSHQIVSVKISLLASAQELLKLKS